MSEADGHPPRRPEARCRHLPTLLSQGHREGKSRSTYVHRALRCDGAPQSRPTHRRTRQAEEVQTGYDRRLQPAIYRQRRWLRPRRNQRHLRHRRDLDQPTDFETFLHDRARQRQQGTDGHGDNNAWQPRSTIRPTGSRARVAVSPPPPIIAENNRCRGIPAAPIMVDMIAIPASSRVSRPITSHAVGRSDWFTLNFRTACQCHPVLPTEVRQTFCRDKATGWRSRAARAVRGPNPSMSRPSIAKNRRCFAAGVSRKAACANTFDGLEIEIGPVHPNHRVRAPPPARLHRSRSYSRRNYRMH